MSTLRRKVLLALSVTALMAVTAASASAATWAPAGHNFQATGSLTLHNMSSWGNLTCAGSSMSGTLANPASNVANTTYPFAGGCTSPQAGITATLSDATGWALQASSTNTVALKRVGASVYLNTYAFGTLVCVTRIDTTFAQTGDWSNATRKLTLSNLPINWQIVGLGPNQFCPGGGASSFGTGQVSASYTLTNTTNPAVPISVQP